MKKTNKKQKELIIKNLSNYYDLFKYELQYDGLYDIDEMIDELISYFDDFYINGEKLEIITENNELEAKVEKDFEQIDNNHAEIIKHFREISNLIDETYRLINEFEAKYEDNIEKNNQHKL